MDEWGDDRTIYHDVQTMENLDDMGIRFQKNDSWQNTNASYRRDYPKPGMAGKSVVAGILSVFCFYLGCAAVWYGTKAAVVVIKWVAGVK